MKNKYDTCRVEVADSDSATLVLGLPPDFGTRMVTIDTSATTEPAPENGKAGAKKEEKPIVDLRQRRQSSHDLHETSHDCGITDMVRLRNL